jgi:hypothetical protein
MPSAASLAVARFSRAGVERDPVRRQRLEPAEDRQDRLAEDRGRAAEKLSLVFEGAAGN